MKNFFYESIDGNLDKLSSERNLRILPTISHDGKWIIRWRKNAEPLFQ